MKDQGYDHAHSSPIKTPQQLAVVVVLAFVVPVIGLILLAGFVISGYRSAALQGEEPDAVARRIQPVARVEFAAAAAAGPRAAKTGEEVYKAVCSACHATGAAGAPKTGDKAAWAPLIKEGMDVLVKDSIKGIRAMPPRGGNPDLSDVEMARAVAYLANQAGANWKEPAAPAAAADSAPGKVVTAAAASVAAAPAPAAASEDKGKATYNQACVACHGQGVAGAPKFGDKALWAPRIKTGIEALYATSIKGKGAMPPKGGNTALADADVKAAVDYMVAAAK